MASARLKQTLAAITPAPKHHFTLFLATSYRATPTFLHEIQQSSLTPLFVGDGAIFFRKPQLSNWGWSHILLFPGKDVKLDPSFQLRQAWSITVEADEGFAKDHDFEQEMLAEHRIRGKGGSRLDVEEPPDLAKTIKYSYRPESNRFWVLHFLRFSGSNADEQYEAHLAKTKEECQLYIHLFGKVTPTSDMEKGTGAEGPDKPDAFALLSFPEERDYAKFLLSEEHRRLVKGTDQGEKEGDNVGFVEESMILTKEMRLPPKDQPIYQHGWQYGNPYEPFGMDFFG